MRYLQRDASGKVVGHYANTQPGYAEEEVPDDHPDILAWQAKRIADEEAWRGVKAQMSPSVLLTRIAAIEAGLAELKKLVN